MKSDRWARAGAVNGARNRAKTHCPAGHPYAGDNLIVMPNGERRCRTCRRAIRRRFSERARRDSGQPFTKYEHVRQAIRYLRHVEYRLEASHTLGSHRLEQAARDNVAAALELLERRLKGLPEARA